MSKRRFGILRRCAIFGATGVLVCMMTLGGLLVTNGDKADAAINSWTQIGSGWRSNCGLDSANELYCWGNGMYFDGGASPLDTFTPSVGDSTGAFEGKTIMKVVSSAGLVCVIADGKAYCWGYNYYGQAGNNSTAFVSVPTPVDTSGVLNGKTVTDIDVNREHACAVADGKAYCWGRNELGGQLGNNSYTNSLVPVAVDTSGVLAGKTVTQITTSIDYSCAIADGKAYCWGEGGSGNLGNGAMSDSLVPVAVDVSGALAGKTVTQIAAYEYHTCAIADGAAYCWGWGYSGRAGISNASIIMSPVAVDTSGVLAGKVVTDIDVGFEHSCAVADGKVYCWGSDYYSQLGDVSSGDSYLPVAVDTSGVLAGKTVTDVSIGAYHSCVIADGAAYCWGENYMGELGNGDYNTSSAVPVAVDISSPGITGADVSQQGGQKILTIHGHGFTGGWGLFGLAMDQFVVTLNNQGVPFCTNNTDLTSADMASWGISSSLYSDGAPCVLLFDDDDNTLATDTEVMVKLPDTFDETATTTIGVIGTEYGVMGMTTFVLNQPSSAPSQPAAPSVVPVSQGDDTVLANTGSDVGLFVALGGGLVGMSAGVLVVMRRRSLQW